MPWMIFYRELRRRRGEECNIHIDLCKEDKDYYAILVTLNCMKLLSRRTIDKLTVAEL